MRASDITNAASRLLFDNTRVRWTAEELWTYVTEGQRSIAILRPDAYSVTRIHRLQPGTRQSLANIGVLGTVDTAGNVSADHIPPASRLLRVSRNFGIGPTGGLTTFQSGSQRAIRTLGRETLDNENPDWHASSAVAVEHYCHDNIDPLTFYVYPGSAPPPGGQAYYVELVYSGIPRQVERDNQVLPLSDQYLGPLLDFVMYRAYTKDANYAGNMDRARMHAAQFGSALGTSMKIEWPSAVPPEKTAPGPRTPDVSRSV